MALSVKDFASKIKEKYPAYKDVPDVELAKKIVEKHPEYKDQVDFESSQVQNQSGGINLGGALNTFKSGVEKAQAASGDFLKGQLQGAASTVAGGFQLLAKARETGYDATVGRLTGTKSANLSDSISRFRQDNLTPTTTAGKVGFATEQVGELLTPTGLESAVAKSVPQMLSKTPKVVQVLGELGAKSLASGTEQAARTALQEGEINDKVKQSGFIGAATPFVSETFSKGLNKIGDFAYSRLVPTTIKEAATDMRKGLNLGEALSSTGFSLTKSSVIRKVGQQVKNLGNQLDDAITGFTTRNPNASYTIDDIAHTVDNTLSDKKIAEKMKIAPVDIEKSRQAIVERLDEYRKLYGKQKLNVNDLQKIKVALGDGLEKAYNLAPSAPIKASALTDMQVRSELRQLVEKHVPQTAEINKKLAPLLESLGRMKEKGAYSGVLTDVIAGSMAGQTAGSIWENPKGFFKNAILGVLAKRGAQSTATKTLVGTLAKNAARLTEDPRFYMLIKRATEIGTQQPKTE